MKKIIFYCVFLLVLQSCTSQNTTLIEPIASYKIKVSEPSGLTFYKEHLYVVSDHNGSIYKLSRKGKVVAKIKSKFKDVEGLTIEPSKEHFWMVDESKRTLIALNFKGEVINKFKIEGTQKEKNSGLEGVCFNSLRNTLFVVNEKSPKELMEISKKGKVLNAHKLNFGKDISGIAFDEKENLFWILSDQSQMLYQVSTKGKLLKSYKTKVKKAEGIAIHQDEIYIVSDSESMLYVFKKK